MDYGVLKKIVVVNFPFVIFLSDVSQCAPTLLLWVKADFVF